MIVLIKLSEKECLKMNDSSDVVGLIPAAGYASRISPLPCSKEIYPVKHPGGRPQAACSYLLRSFAEANVDQTYLVLRTGKWDIPTYLKDGSAFDLDLAYLVTDGTDGVPQTIDKAYSFIKNKRVAFGFPDILFHPSNAFSLLFDEQEQSDADLVLGLFEAENPSKMDMVKFDEEKLKDIIIKPEKSNLTYTWLMAVWNSSFSEFLHDYSKNYANKKMAEQESEMSDELYIGDIFREAIREGFETAYVKLGGSYLDIGTPEELERANDY